MQTIKISDELRAKAERWMLEVGMPILAKKKEAPARERPPKKEFENCEAQYLQVGDRIKFGRYLNSKTWVVEEVKQDVYYSISPCVDYVIVTCRDPRKKVTCRNLREKSIQQFSLPTKRLIIRELKLQSKQETV